MASYANKLKAAAILERFGRPPEFANLVCAIVNNTYIFEFEKIIIFKNLINFIFIDI